MIANLGNWMQKKKTIKWRITKNYILQLLDRPGPRVPLRLPAPGCMNRFMWSYYPGTRFAATGVLFLSSDNRKKENSLSRVRVL